MSTGVSTFATVGDVVTARAVTTVFQPIVRLDDRQPGSPEIVGMEALTRGPKSTPWESPTALFEAARAAGRGRLAELDWVCRASAYRAAIDGDLPDGISLFVNAEPSALSVPCPPDLTDTILAAQLRLRVVTELPERAIAGDPSALLDATSACRGSGWGVALDDVGTDRSSLALLSFVAPDVVKLDTHLVQQPGTDKAAHVVNAVLAYAESSGAAILAEGIETPAHLAAARSMGATLGQGWLFGRPGPLPAVANLRSPRRTVPFIIAPPSAVAPSGGSARTPYETVSARRPTTESTKRLLLATTRLLEARALDADEPPVLLACFQEGRHFGRSAAERFGRYAGSSALVAVFATDLPTHPVAGVRGVALAADDPLRGEWNVVAVGPHFAGALVARDLGDDGPDAERRFAYTVTYDRELVLEAARALLNWG